MRRPIPAGSLRRAALWLAAVSLLALPARADPAPLEVPRLSLEFEGQFAQPDAPSTRGFGVSFATAWRFTDQLSVLGAVSTLVTPGGPFSTLGTGVRALLDITPLAPFIDVQVVLLGPESATGYTLATRLGGGADYQVASGLAVGLAVRTLTPMNGSISVSQGLEVGLRLVLIPSLLN